MYPAGGAEGGEKIDPFLIDFVVDVNKPWELVAIKRNSYLDIPMIIPKGKRGNPLE